MHIAAVQAAVVLAAVVTIGAGASQAPPPVRFLAYAGSDDSPRGVDLHMPAGVSNPPLVVWVHGGAWRQGTRASVRREFTEHGFATASVDYRLSTEATFPAMVHDVKAAIRMLRARAAEFGYRADRIAIAGDSAGAHLAALVGVSSRVEALEGTVGTHLDQSSDVQAILAYYPATNLTTILAQSTPFGLGVRVPALELLLGGQPDRLPELARLASPVFHVDRADPPLLMFHGDQDPQMPINQSHELQGAYESHALDVDLVVVHGAAHGGDVFYEGANLTRALAFLARTIGS